MIEILPNWHPVLVHFTVALIAASALFFLCAIMFKGSDHSNSLNNAGLWTLWLGAAVTTLTVAAGFYAYGSVDHDVPSHLAMTDHRNWAIPSAIVLWSVAIWTGISSKRQETVGVARPGLVLLATVVIAITAFKGGELVYRYGLGVQSLPQVTGDGHDHGEGAHDEDVVVGATMDMAETDHEAGAAHDHGAETSQVPPQAPMSDPASVADAFHAALKSDDTGAVARLLAGDVVILESGHAQHSRQEYMDGHMKSDMSFLPGITREVQGREASQSENLAWVITHSRMHGDYKGQAIDMNSREMLVMKHNGDAWKISLVHWGDK